MEEDSRCFLCFLVATVKLDSNCQTGQDCLRACAKLIQFDWSVHYSMPTTEDAHSKVYYFYRPKHGVVFSNSARGMEAYVPSLCVQVHLWKQRPGKNFITCLQFYQMSTQQTHVQQHRDITVSRFLHFVATVMQPTDGSTLTTYSIIHVHYLLAV